MSGQAWPGQEVSGPAPSVGGSSIRPVISVPNTDQQHDNSVQDAQLDLSRTQTGLSATNSAREAHSAQIGNAATLRQGYEAIQPVKEYRAVLPSLMSGLKANPDATGDNTLLYAYAKIMDPGSVVRESEQASAAGGASVFDNTVANLKKQFGVEGGGALSPDVRQRLKRDLNARAVEIYRTYLLQRQRFAADAKAYGINPARVIGPDDFDAVRPQYEKAFKSVFGGKANEPEQRGGLPVGTEVQFGAPPEGPFDREAYLKQNFGITPDQETNAVAFWNQNRGNKALTPDAARAWYQKNGIQPPADEALGKMVKDAQDGSNFGPIDTSGPEQAYRARLQANLDKRGFDPNSGASYADRFTQGGLLGNFDEIYGVQGAVGNLFGNKGVADGYIENRDTARLAMERDREAQGVPGYAAEFAGSLVPALLTGNPSSAGEAAVQGAALGATAGFGYGEGLGGSVTGAVTNAIGGAALGAGAQKGMNALAARSTARAPTEGAQVIGAADRLNDTLGTNIQPLPADVGGPATRAMTGASAMTPLGVQPIVHAAENVTAEAKAARDAIAGLAGPAQELETTGESGLNGAMKYIKQSRAKVTALYTKARSLGGAQAVDLTNARGVLDRNIAELEQVPGGGPGLAKLKALREELNHPYPVEGVKGMRTALRDEFASTGLRGSDLERRVTQITDAAEQDIVDSLSAAGKKGAAKAYAEAAAAHKERVGIIDNVLSPIIGAKGDAPKSGEQIMATITAMTKQNNSKLGKFLAALPAEDAATVRATLISRLGHASNGTQNAAGDAFSLPQFLTHWNAMTPGAKATLFGGELRAALDDLATVAGGTKAAQRFENVSKTGNVVATLATGGLLTQAANHPIATILGVSAQYGLGKLLASPRFARWVAKVPSNSAAVPSYIGKLSNIAAADSVIAGDALGLQRQLQRAFGNAQGSPAGLVPLRAAAQSPADQEGAGKTNTAAGPQ